MTFTPQIIDNTTPGESLRSGADKINMNFAAIAQEFDSTGGHDHDGTDSKTIDHTNLGSKGSNTHSQIDSFISSKAAASGLASLNASSLVVQNPADATATAGANKIPISDSSGKLNSWLGYGNSPGEVCAGDDERLPTTDQKTALSGTVGAPGSHNPLVTNEDIATIAIEINTDLLELNYNPSAYTAELTPEAASTSQMAAHLAGINSALRSIQARLTALEP